MWDIAGLRKKTLPNTVTPEEKAAAAVQSSVLEPNSMASKLGKAMPWLKKPLIVSPTAMIVKPSPFARRLKTVYLLRQIHLWSKRNH